MRRDEYPWPSDLRAFGVIAMCWCFYLVWRALIGDPFASNIAPVAQYRGNVYGAGPVVLLTRRASWAIGIGMIAGRRWSLLLSLFYMAETVVSYLVFIIAYMDTRAEWTHVRMAARLGPSIVLITLYLWIRSRDLIFDPARRSEGM